jgi:pimeloyl-ACP methyl ester carboxylesterase
MRARRLTLTLAACAVFGIPSPLLAQHGLSPEELAVAFPPDKIFAGVRITRQECEALKLAVWVEHQHGSECIRYYPSRNIDGAARAVFYFHGDLLEGRNPLPGAFENNTVAGQLKQAQNLAGANGVPFVLVSRPGCFGSSGERSARRRPKEYFSMNAAVDAIKARYKINEVILSGQSGGAAVVGALLTLGRTDVACATASSGVYDAIGRANRIHETKRSPVRGCDVTGYCDPYNVTDFVSGVAHAPSRRIFIIGDPADTNTLFEFQHAFFQKLRKAGHDAILVEAKGEGPDRHRLSHMATRTAGWCNAGLPSEEIAGKIRVGEYALYDARRRKPGAGAAASEAKE